MPNWVTNRIKFSNKASFEAFRERYVRENAEEPGSPTFDFNILAPMPESLGIEAGSRTDDGISIVLLRMRQNGIPGVSETERAVERARARNPFSFLSRKSKSDAQIEEDAAEYKKTWKLDEVLNLGKKAIQNILDHGYPTWYDWRLDNWGTKWNANSYRDDPEELEVWFETAWSTPEPIIAKLVSLMGPEAFEEIEYADKDIGCNCGRYRFEDGAPAFPSPYEDGSDQAMECAIRLNNAYDWYELKDGHWIWKKDETPTA